MNAIAKKEYADKVRAEIERNKDKKILWADFSVSRDKKDVIVQFFSSEYSIKISPCISCKGYDIYIQKK